MKRWNVKGKHVLLFIGIILLAACLIASILVVRSIASSSGVSSFSSKTVVNGKTTVKVGSLKGSHTVEKFSIAKPEHVRIPYEASSQEGTFTLTVSSSNKIMWEKRIPAAEHGMIEFAAERGDYVITIHSELAKKIVIKAELGAYSSQGKL